MLKVVMKSNAYNHLGIHPGEHGIESLPGQRRMSLSGSRDQLEQGNNVHAAIPLKVLQRDHSYRFL